MLMVNLHGVYLSGQNKMSHQDTKPNIKRVVADTFGTYPGWLVTSAIAAATCFTAIPAALDSDIPLPDQTGTVLEESITAQHQESFAALQEMKAQISLLEAETAFTGGSQELTDLKTDFGKKAVTAYTDLYLAGAGNDGAALSEENFESLRNAFAEKIANPAEFGFQEHISAAMLDETLAKTELNTQSDAARFETAKQIDGALAQSLEDQKNQENRAFTLPLIGSVFSVLMLYMLAAGVSENWGREPRRVPRRKSKSAYGNH